MTAYKEQLTSLINNNAEVLYTKASCAVLKNGQSVYSHCTGCSRETLFDLASVTKILTGTMIFMLAGSGELSLDDPISGILKDTGSITARRFEDITVRRLLTHSSGLPAWFPFYAQKGNFWQVLEYILSGTPPLQGFAYSDLGFMILGEIVCRITGRTLIYNLDRINDILGSRFTYRPNTESCAETERGNRVEAGMCAERGLSYDGFRDTDKHIRGQANDGNAFYYWAGCAGHAGTFGTADDLLRLASLYLNKGSLDGKQYIPVALAEESIRDSGNSRGLMWDLSGIFANGFGHTGFTGTSLWICSEKNAAAAILTNRLATEPPSDIRDFRLQVHKLIYGGL